MFAYIKSLTQDRDLKAVARHSGVLLGGNMAASLLNLVTITLVAGALGARGFGSLVLIQTYCLVVDKLINFQSWETLVKFGAVAWREKNWSRLGGLIKFGFLLDLFSALAATLVAVAGADWVAPLLGLGPQHVWLMRVYALVILFNLSGTPTGLLRLLERFNLLALNHVLLAVTRLAAVAAACALKAGFSTFVLIYVGARIFSHVFLFLAGLTVLLRQAIPGWWRGKLTDMREPLHFALWSNLKTTTGVPVKHFDMIILGAVLSAEAVAVFKVFKEFARVLNQLTDPLFQVLFPEFSKKMGVDASRQAIRLFKNSVKALYTVMVPVGTALLIAAPLVLHLFFGEPYVSHLVILLVYILLKVVFIGLSPLNPFFFAVGYAKYNTFIALAKNILYSLVLYFSCYYLGLFGILVAYVAQVVFNFGVKTVILRRKRGEWQSA